VAAATIVKDFKVFEDGVGQFHPGAPALAVEQFDLHPTPKGFHDGIVKAMPTEPIDGSRPDSTARRVKAQELNCVPWSLWMMVSLRGRRWSMAMPSALVTSAVLGVESIDRPITRRDQTSSTTAQ
jgi:hypothetical protein